MILDKYVNIKITNSNHKHYDKYKPFKNGDIITIDVDDLAPNSKLKINVKCEICGVESIKTYQNHRLRKEKRGIYCCHTCSKFKNKLTNNEKYGCDYPLQNSEVKEKHKQVFIERYGVENISQRKDIIELRRNEMKTEKRQNELRNGVIEKYGVDNVSKLDFIKEKKKETTLKNYSVENPSQSEIIKIKKEITCETNYGVKHPLQSKELFEKMIIDNIEKYGVEFYMQTEEYKKKVNESNLKKYGVNWYLQSEDIKEKSKKTCLEKYGVEHALQSEIIQDKSRETRIKNGHEIPEHLLTDFQIYKKKIRYFTHKNKKKLYENWNGYDYYDNEYIKDNKDNNKNNYPTIDHKTSVYFGFNNNIEPEELCKIENLCITKKSLNSSKKENNELSFKNKIKQHEKNI